MLRKRALSGAPWTQFPEGSASLAAGVRTRSLFRRAIFRRQKGAKSGCRIFTGGTAVSAGDGFEADVLVEDGKVAAVGTDLSREVAEEVNVSGKLLMPGFPGGHTHLTQRRKPEYQSYEVMRR